MFPVLCPTHTCPTHTFVLGSVAMAARLVSPYPLVWSTGLARAGVGCQGGPCPIRSWPVDGLGAAGVPGRRRGHGSESSQTQLAGFEDPAPAQPNPNHPAPIMLPRLDALDGRQGPGRQGAPQRPTGNQNGALGGRRRPGGLSSRGGRHPARRVGIPSGEHILRRTRSRELR